MRWIRKSLVGIAAFAALALVATTIPPTSVSAKELPQITTTLRR
jgi:hypothetical protein